MVKGKEGTKRGVPGSDAGCPCPDLDNAAVCFVRSYRPGIDWALHQACVPVADRPDLVQDITVRILRRFRQHGPLGAGSHLGYAITVARNVIANYNRTRAKSTTAHVDVDAVERVGANDMLPDAQVMRWDAHARLRYAIASLSPHRRYLVESVMAGQDLAEMARQNGWKFATVRVQYYRAVQDLRKMLVRHA